MSQAGKKPQLWYTRRDDLVRGPFPAGMITRHILLGRILQTDELSCDKIEWRAVAELPELIPPEMKADLSIPENRERLRIAFMREDERRSGDRRKTSRKNTLPVSGSFVERRVVENEATVRHRERKTAFSNTLKQQDKNATIRLFILALVMLGVFILSISLTPEESRQQLIAKCQVEPGPNIDWNDCGKEGVDLSGLSLAGAKLRSVTFSGATLKGTVLIGADMSYTNFANSNAAGARLQRSKLVGAVLRNANFAGSDLSHADLSFAILNGTDLRNANLNGANLMHVVLNDAILDGANLNGAILDKAIWTDNTVCAPTSVGQCIPIK